jgi:hypothetical protein
MSFSAITLPKIFETLCTSIKGAVCVFIVLPPFAMYCSALADTIFHSCYPRK